MIYKQQTKKTSVLYDAAQAHLGHVIKHRTIGISSVSRDSRCPFWPVADPEIQIKGQTNPPVLHSATIIHAIPIP